MADYFFIDTRSRRYQAFTAYEFLTSPALMMALISGATLAAILALSFFVARLAVSPPLLGVALISGGGSLFLLLLFFFATTYLPSVLDPAAGRSLTDRSSFALLKILRASGASPSGAAAANVVQSIFNSPQGHRALSRLQLSPESVSSHMVSSAAHLSAQAIQERGSALAQSQQSPRLEIEHLLGAVFLQPVWQTFLRQADLQEEDIIFMVWWLVSARQANEAKRAWWRRDRILSASGIGLGFAAGFTPLVDRLSRIPQGNLWDMFSEGQDELVEQLTLTLARMRQSNVLLVGQPGVGRLGVIQSLARRVQTHHSHPALNGQRVVYLHIGALLAQGTSAASQLAIISNILTEIERAGNIIAVIDGLSSILASENEQRLDLTAILLPFFSSLAVRVIVIISSDEYHLRLATNEELVHFFEVISVPPASPAATQRSLARATPLIERTQGVFITYPALEACVQKTSGILQHIPYPERAFDVLEEAVVAASIRPDRVVTADLVEQLITNKVGIPFTKLKREEKQYLLDLENTMHQRLVNQNQAVAALARAMIRARSGVRNTERPIGSFLFLGPTGVGKTEAAKTLAATYFGSEQYLSRLDMSEFGRPASVASLIGSHTQPVGRLTSLISDKPFTVLLLDEFEKAHRNVQQLFLQVFDEGRLTDARGHTVSFQHAIIIATSNAGADFIRAEAKDGLLPTGFTNTLQDHLMTQGIFTPELMNRFDGVITFAPLNPEHLQQIARLMLVKLNARLDEQHGVTVAITPELIDYLISTGYSPEFGARPLARAIQDTVEYEVAKRVLAGLAAPGEVITLSLSRLYAERQR